MKKFLGKRLLLLGTTIASESMITYAQQEGAYVFITDNLPINSSKVKQLADEVLSISTRDIDALCSAVKEYSIDGVLCGVSENNLISVYEICDILQLPCYVNKNLWEMCQDKKNFKELCIKHNIPVPREYLFELSRTDIYYPVIVKPVDGYAAVGITICNNEAELKVAYGVAKNASKKGEVIIEEYVIGDEFTAVYTIKDSEPSLSIVRDRYPSLDHKGITSQFDASVAPSQYYSMYCEKVDPYVKKMLKDIGAYAGTVFVQGIATNDRICIFECGYRINALCDFYNLEAVNGINYMKMIVDYALTGKMDDHDLSKDNAELNQYCCIFNMSAHGGVISKLEGLERCKEIPGVVHAEFLLTEGDTVIENNSMAQSVFRAQINVQDLLTMKSTIKLIQKIIKVIDSDGNDMLFKSFDVERLKETL